MTCHICRWLLTLQFLEKQAGILVDILNQLINEDDDKDHSGSPRDLQDKGVPVDNANISVDQSFRSERAVMHGMWEPEYESEDEND